jgi:hypothetical protein
MMQPTKVSRPAAVYILAGLMVLIAVVFGGFFVVWCGTLRFLFSGTGWRAFALLILPGFIAWRAFAAARDAWDGLPSAPVGAAVTFLAIAVLIALAQIDAMFASGRRLGDLFSDFEIKAALLTVAPHVVLFGLITLAFWLSPSFDQHRFETEVEYEIEAADAPASDDDDDDGLFLGGA